MRFQKFFAFFNLSIAALVFPVQAFAQPEYVDPPLPYTVANVTSTFTRLSKQQANGDQPQQDDSEAGNQFGPKGMEHFLRIRRNAKRKPVAFESSVTRYVAVDQDGKPVYVDLIGVVHIGETEYYETLNETFKNYDGVLFELIAPEGTVIPKGGDRGEGGGNPIAALQQGMQAVLGLEFQLEHINYEQENFVHADMTPEEYVQSMSDNDESFGKMFLKAVGQSMAQSGKASMSNFDLMRVMLAKDKEVETRKVFAKQMMDMEGGMAIFEGREGSTIINHRNGKAMQVLDRELAAGKKKLAIFYGAGHLPDMDRRLTSDFKMKRAGQYWLEAWKLKR